jgi:hypothetical protein
MVKSTKIQQLTFFELTQEEINAQKIDKIQESLHKVRKGAYANIGDINKRLERIETMFEHMIHVLCKGEKSDS